MRIVDPDKHAVQRQAILEAARNCFVRNGFSKTSTEAICAEAGTSSGKLFHYFPTKKAIILAVVEDQNRQMAEWIDTFRQQADGSVALIALLDGILFLAGDPAERHLILETAAEGARDGQVAAANAAGDRLLAQGLTELLDSAIAGGQARPLVTTEHAVRFLMVLIDGLFSRVAVDGGFDPALERASIIAIVRAILGMSGAQSHE